MSRWETLTLTTSSDVPGFEDVLNSSEVEPVLKFLHCEDGPRFPRLEELNIQCRCGYFGAPRSRFALSWTSPNLCFLRCAQYLPFPSTVFSSVSTFSFMAFVQYLWSGGESDSQAQRLLAFLASTPSISSFELELYDPGYIILGVQQLQECLCPAITSFHLRLPEFQVFRSEGRGRKRFITAFLPALRMPHLEDLTISIDLKNMDGSSAFANLLNNCSHVLLPPYLADPSAPLSSLTYKLKCDANGEDHSHIFPLVFAIPLDRIPTVSTLTVTTCTSQVLFSWDEDDTSGNSESCSLREIQFGGCKNMGIGDLRSAFHSLSTEVWDVLERVVVENCRHLGYEKVLEIVGKEKLQYFS